MTPDVNDVVILSDSVWGNDDDNGNEMMTTKLTILICAVGLPFPTGRADPMTVALGSCGEYHRCGVIGMPFLVSRLFLSLFHIPLAPLSFFVLRVANIVDGVLLRGIMLRRWAVCRPCVGQWIVGEIMQPSTR